MHDHFKGKDVVEHLREARARGTIAVAEIHGTEMPGYLSAGADSAKETAFVFLLLWILVHPINLTLFFLFGTGWVLWKIGRSSLLGWARLERLHRLIEEERWEIEHEREQEKQELTELYRAKGLSGKLLDEVISVLMSDDSRLLRIMLEEEMGLTLEVYEHPLKQSAGAAGGVLLSAVCFIASLWLHPIAPLIATGCVTLVAAYIAAKAERNRPLEAVVWSLSLTAFATGITYFLAQLL
jgi:hypothetical protein